MEISHLSFVAMNQNRVVLWVEEDLEDFVYSLLRRGNTRSLVRKDRDKVISNPILLHCLHVRSREWLLHQCTADV